MNTYLTQSKARLIRQAQKDLLDVYGIKHVPFTRKIYFYFFELDNKKYVHKESLKFVYSNADTYTKEVDPYFCHLEKVHIPVDVCSFLEIYNSDFLPKLIDSNDKFFVYDYVDGEPIDYISEQEFNFLSVQHELMGLTPFYNSMTYNLVRTDNGLKLIDLKHFEQKSSLPFFVYLYNEDNCVNTLYIKSGTNVAPIKKHLSIDYPIDLATTVTY